MNFKKSNQAMETKDNIVKKFISLDGRAKSEGESLEVIEGGSSEPDYLSLADIPSKEAYQLKLNSSSSLKGDLKISGLALIDGQVEGNIVSDSTIIIGQNATIAGNIKAKNIALFGQGNGDLEAEEKLILCTSAKLKGNIQAKNINIQSGASFEGNCRMGE